VGEEAEEEEGREGEGEVVVGVKEGREVSGVELGEELGD